MISEITVDQLVDYIREDNPDESVKKQISIMRAAAI